MKKSSAGMVMTLGLFVCGFGGRDRFSHLPNNLPIPNRGGLSASFSTAGFIDLQSDFATPQGTNGRSCTTCHSPLDGWGLRPQTVRHLFERTQGLDPLFNPRDADVPNPDLSTVSARRDAFSMLLQGKFIRRVNVPATAEFEVIDVDDPFGVATPSRLISFRKSMPTANFRSVTVSWEGRNTQEDLHAGLARQARSNITGAQEGEPATEDTIADIVGFEVEMSHAQWYVPGVGRLDRHGGRGGPELASRQPLVAGPFDLYDGWAKSRNPKRRQIARGQALFNDGDANGRSCGGCHNAANNGQNVGGALFDVGASDAEFAKPDMAVYTLENLETGEVVETTDPGRAMNTGAWSDLNRFKTVNLRGLASRAPYFHNGIAETLHDVIYHYEVALGFDFSPQQERDLVAFLNAL